jgi:hypothetical protein
LKKIILGLLLCASVSYSQVKFGVLTEQTETVSFEQYDLIKKVNEFCPDLLVSKQIKNVYSGKLLADDKVLLQSILIQDIPSDCDFYSITIMPGNYKLNYFYRIKEGDTIYGDVTLFNGAVHRTFYSFKGNSRKSKYIINGKLINELNN